MESLLNKVKKEIIETLQTGDLDAPYLQMGTITYTKKQMIQAIENESELGEKIICNILNLTLDLVNRGKEKLDDFEKRN